MIVHDPPDGIQVVDRLGPLLNSALAAALVETLLYGIHLVLFCNCTYFLARKRTRAGTIILLSVFIMFMLTTIDVAFTFRLIAIDLPALLRSKIRMIDVLWLIALKENLFVTDNLIADGLLLYRCYMVWKGNRFDRFIAFVASSLLVADTIWGYLQTAKFCSPYLRHVLAPLYLWSVFGFNIAMTATTAGRLWWTAQIYRPILGEQSVQSYNIAIAIIIQSGAVYSLSVMLLLILWKHPCKLILHTIVYRLVGIIPTLMIVQVELGGRSQKAGNGSVKLSTNPVFTTIAVDAISTPSLPHTVEGASLDTEHHLPHVNRDTHAYNCTADAQ